MKDFQELPNKNIGYGLFLVQQLSQFDEQFLSKLHTLSQQKKYQKINPLIFSLEKLTKGQHQALVFYGPKDLVLEFPELQLLALEEYTTNLYVSKVQAFEVELPKQKKLPADFSNKTLFEKLSLDQDEYLFWQIVLIPSKISSNFQAGFRIVLSSAESSRRVILAKMFEEQLSQQTNLSRVKRKQSSSQIYNSYKKRAVFPSETRQVLVNVKQVLALLGC